MNLSLGDHSNIYETEPINIKRIAIDPRGCLGSIYNGYTDNINGKLKANIEFSSCKSRDQTKCVYVQNCKRDVPNIFEFADIDHQLRLSILLKMSPATGIASLIDYPLLIDKHTRFLYIYHESNIEFDKHRLHELRKPVTTAACETYGTHIITGIVYGVHLLVILQLPPDQNKDIDMLLLNIYPSLSNNQHALKMNSTDKTLLNRITSTKVYSNIHDLTKIGKFEDVYDVIIELLKSDKKHRPLKYILTPIQWFYGPKFASNFPTLVSCEPNEIQTLQRYLLQQSSEFKRLVLRINHDLPELLQGKLNNQLRNFQNELSRLRILQDKDIARIRNLIWMIRKENNIVVASKKRSA